LDLDLNSLKLEKSYADEKIYIRDDRIIHWYGRGAVGVTPRTS